MKQITSRVMTNFRYMIESTHNWFAISSEDGFEKNSVRTLEINKVVSLILNVVRAYIEEKA